MCGIIGFINASDNYKFSNLETLKKLTSKLSHRGPDHIGTYINDKENIYFGHTRLSILDLSSNGNQPMYSSNKRYMIIYNGEIYNHINLRNELKYECPEIEWRGNSDTETLVNAFSFWGINKTLNKLVGMFAIALYDLKKSKLHLIRDRFGEKPLYFGYVNESFLFSSELKPISFFPNFVKQLSLKSLSLYFQLNYVPSPYSIYKNIYKLEKASLLSLDITNLKNQLIKKDYRFENLQINKWWEYNYSENNNKNLNFEEKLNLALNNSVKKQLISDVPIGSFLSGGIDSSLITSIMQRNSKNNINTYTVGFENKLYDESIYAKKIANYLKTNHNEIILKEKEIMDPLIKISYIYDEPFSDSSQIPTYLISNYAAKSIKVALTGDGADELFGGYNRYRWIGNLENKKLLFLLLKNKNFYKLFKLFPKLFWEFLETIINLLLKDKGVSLLEDKLNKLFLSCQNSNDLSDLYLNILKNWKDEDRILKNFHFDNNDYFNKFYNSNKYMSISEKMMHFDINNYLTDDILCKVDRASMSNSLETRAPMLDNDVVNISSELPLFLKINGNTNKFILKQILSKYLPDNMFNRSKMGFSIPIGYYLKSDLREWAEDLINKTKFNPYLNYETVSNTWEAHLSNKFNFQDKLWSIIIFQSWYENNY